jgi:hypothetical protein
MNGRSDGTDDWSDARPHGLIARGLPRFDVLLHPGQIPGDMRVGLSDITMSGIPVEIAEQMRALWQAASRHSNGQFTSEPAGCPMEAVRPKPTLARRRLQLHRLADITDGLSRPPLPAHAPDHAGLDLVRDTLGRQRGRRDAAWRGVQGVHGRYAIRGFEVAQVPGMDAGPLSHC